MNKKFLLCLLSAWAIPAISQAQTSLVDEILKTGIDYVVSEYALDQVSYTRCGLALAKRKAPANFEKVKSEFISVFGPEDQAKLEKEFYSNEMAGLKKDLGEKKIWGGIQKAKTQVKDMDKFCGELVDQLIAWNNQTAQQWNLAKAKIPR